MYKFYGNYVQVLRKLCTSFTETMYKFYGKHVYCLHFCYKQATHVNSVNPKLLMPENGKIKLKMK